MFENLNFVSSRNPPHHSHPAFFPPNYPEIPPNLPVWDHHPRHTGQKRIGHDRQPELGRPPQTDRGGGSPAAPALLPVLPGQ